MAATLTKISPAKRQTLSTAVPITLTVAQLDNAEITTSASVALTLPSADSIVTYITSLHIGQVMTNESFDFDVRNNAGSGSTTLVLGAGMTLSTGSGASIPGGNIVHFILRVSVDAFVPGSAEAVLASYPYSVGSGGTIIVGQIGTCATPVQQEFVYAASGVANKGIVLQGDAADCLNTTRLVTATAGGHTYDAIFPDLNANGDVVINNAAQTLSSKTLLDSSTLVANTADTTKHVAFSLGGMTASRTLTLASAATVDRTITFPDATDTLVGKATTDTLTNKTLLDGSTLIANTADPTKHVAFSLGGMTGSRTLTLASVVTVDRTITFPDATDTLVARATTDTLTNKTLTAPVIATIVNGGQTLTLPAATDTLVARNTVDTLTNKTIVGTTNSVRATILGTATTDVVVNGATAPSANYQLIAASGVAANWLQMSGQYDPAITTLSAGLSSVAQPGGSHFIWMRSGSMISVWGALNITQTVAGSDNFHLSLPIVPAVFTGVYQCFGTMQPVALYLANEYGGTFGPDIGLITIIGVINTLTNALTGTHIVSFMYTLV